MPALALVRLCCPTPGCSRLVRLPLFKGDEHSLCDECEADVKPRKCKMRGCSGSLRECRAVAPEVRVCQPCAVGDHVDHHRGVWRYSDDTHPVVCNCQRCEPGFALEPSPADSPHAQTQLSLGLQLTWSELRPPKKTKRDSPHA